MSLKRKRLAIILSAITVAIVLLFPSVYYLNNFVHTANQPPISYSGGYTNYTWSENFSNFEGYMPNLSSTLDINQNSQSNSFLQLSLFRIGYNGFQYDGGPIMNLYVTLKGSLSTELRPAYIKFYVVTSNIGNISDPHYWDSGGVNPISPINMSITSTDNSMSFFGNSTQTMSFTANFLNEANNRSSYNFSIDEMNVHFLLPSFLVSNNSIKLSFGATLYGLSKTVSIQSNIVMNDTDLSG